MNNLNWLAVTPEILLLGMACLVALVDLFVTSPNRRPTYWLSLLSLAGVAGLHLVPSTTRHRLTPCRAWW